jgi:methionine-S-sulfoxide reductase
VWQPDDAALSQVFAMTSPKLAATPEKYRGKFIVPLAQLSSPPSHAANMTLQKALWKFTESIIEEKTKGVMGSAGKSLTATATATTETTEMTETTATGTATFAAGCFWSVELAFQRLPGVVSTSVGYVGGTVANPNYEGVAAGTTQHAEAVQIQYDTSSLTFSDLLDVFFEIHDATQLNRQGPDVGTQYRSVIVAHTPEQKTLSKKALASSDKQLATQILDISDHKYWVGEDYHQQYLEKAGQSAEKGSLAPIQCYGDRGPIKHLSKQEKLVKLFQRRAEVVDVEQLEL